MVVEIKGIKYKVILLEEKIYKKQQGSGESAFDSDKKQLIFKDSSIYKACVVHEVTHAFIYGLHLASCTNLTLEDFEEIICEMMELHILDINRISNQILRFLKEDR